MPTGPQQAWWKAPLRISVIYAVVAAIYILVSDQALYRAVQGDEKQFAAWQSAKGLAFVAVSSILIFLMVGRRERAAAAARLELEKDEEAFELFFRNAPVPLIVYDRHTRKILEINAAAERLYGGPASAMRGWRIEDLHPPEDFDELMRYLGKEVDGAVALTARHRRLNGEVFEASVLVQPVTLRGRACRMLTAKDLTAEKRLASALAAAENATAEAEAARAAFLARISNNMRTPINNVIGFLDLLEIEENPERRKGFVKEARDCAGELLGHIERLLKICERQARMEQQERRREALPALLGLCAAEFEEDARHKGLGLTREVRQGAPLHIEGQVATLLSLLRLLLANAIRSASSGQVVLTAALEKMAYPELVLSIAAEETNIRGKSGGPAALPTASPRSPDESHPPLAIGLPSAQHLCKIIGASLAVRHPSPGSMVFEVRIPGRSGEDGVFRWG